MLKIYISGPVTGLPISYVQNAFKNAENHFKSLGYKVVNPFSITTINDSWFDNMQRTLNLLKDCTHIHFLPKGENSKGVAVERIYAEMLNIKIINE